MGLYAALVSLNAAARVLKSGAARVNADAHEPLSGMPVHHRFAGTGPSARHGASSRKKCPPRVSQRDRIGKIVTYRESNNKKKYP
jgi:hypothetical protein